MDNAERSDAAVASIPGCEKAALLLLMMGETHAAKVLQHVAPEDVERIGTAMAGIKRVDNSRAMAVVQDFQHSAQSENSLAVGVQSYVRKVFTTALGEQAGGSLARRVLGDQLGQEMEELRWVEPDALAQMLKDEHPQMIAITLAHLEPEQAAKVLAKLPEAQQNDVVYRIANMKTIPDTAMSQLQGILKKKLSVSAKLKNRQIDGAATAAGLINGLGGDAETRILESLAKNNEELSARIQDLMFVFSNLINISDKGVQQLLREVSSDLLPIALKGAGEEVKEKILRNMSKRAREMLLDDMDARGPIKISEVEQAQKEILTIARSLAESGQIDLGRGGDDYI
ncbi:MAG: flagellar motor switch protein FliG [Spongiibacter sp.]